MTTPNRLQSLVYPVRDLAAARALFTALLGEPTTDQPFYVGFTVEGLEIGLNPGGHAQGDTGPIPFWAVEDIEGRVAELLAAGGTEARPVTKVFGGTTIAVVADADGNPIGLIHRS